MFAVSYKQGGGWHFAVFRDEADMAAFHDDTLALDDTGNQITSLRVHYGDSGNERDPQDVEPGADNLDGGPPLFVAMALFAKVMTGSTLPDLRHAALMAREAGSSLYRPPVQRNAMRQLAKMLRAYIRD